MADELTRDEVLGASILLFMAGITTTSGLISNSLAHLDSFPEQRDLMQREPLRFPPRSRSASGTRRRSRPSSGPPPETSSHTAGCDPGRRPCEPHLGFREPR